MCFVLLVVLLLAPSPGRAQPLQFFEDLALRINLDDRLQIEDLTGATTAGRLTRLTGTELTLLTDTGEKHFTIDTVRGVAVRSHPLRKGALIGAAVFAVLGAVAICEHEGGGGCGFVGALGAAPIGAGVGLTLGALIPRMTPIYRVSEIRASQPARPSGVQASWLEDLALRVNLDDRLEIEDRSGIATAGRLIHLTADELVIRTDAGEKRFTREAVRRVALRRQLLRTATLVGAGAGALYGALSACTGGANADCPDGPIIGSAIGAGAGVLVGAILRMTTLVYPEPEHRTTILPAISPHAVGVRVTRRW